VHSLGAHYSRKWRQQETILADNSQVAQANAKFKKLQRAEEAKKNLSDHEAGEAAIAAKTARLRAERLARDAALALTSPPVSVKKRAAKKTKAKTESLSNWLNSRDSSGRKS
jgi:DUF4097 and DUF4098 domain-containing protein YvlB